MKFCFWGDIAAAIRGTTIGGGELQMALLAKSLAKSGHQVVIIDPFSNESFTTEEGIEILHVPDWNKGLPILRVFWYRFPALYKLFVKQKADYYYARMRSYFNLASYLAAKRVKGKFLLALASDVDVLSIREKYKFQYKANFQLRIYLTEWLPNDLVFNYLLRRADYIIRQHSGQVVNTNDIKDKVIEFPNIIDRENLPLITNPSKDYLIYVGSLAMLKGADKLYELVRDIDNSSSVMVVGQPNDRGSIPIFERMKKLRNADLKGRNRHSNTLQLLANAKALINTSDYEGFPNVFLEAWAMGIPVLSLKVNPGNIFDKYDLGICFKGDLKKMKEYINLNKTIVFNAEKIKYYVIENHDFNDASNRFMRLLEK